MIFEGIVVEGNRIGRTIGFPTANIAVENAQELPSGVFACRVWLPAPARVSHTASETLCGMLNIGTRPTIITATPPRTIEVHILDYSGNLYGSRLRVEILDKIRSERKFSDLTALQTQLAEDKTAALQIFQEAEKKQ